MHLPEEIDVVVIGAGPAGLAAATALAAHAKVLVIDREPQAGGIPRHCDHYPYGLREFGRLMKGPAYAKALVDKAQKAGVQIATRVNVTSLHDGPRVDVTSDHGPHSIKARAVLLATGVRETSRATRLIGGEKPAGVIATGALQGMITLQKLRPFRNPVILGTELVAFSAIMTSRHAGIRPVAMIEPEARATARWPAALYPRLLGIPLHLNCRILRIEGRERVEAVVIASPAGEQRIACDGVITTGRFQPEATLLAFGPVPRDPATKGPVIDSAGACSGGYFAAGNLLRPAETAGFCWAEGRAVAEAIRLFLSAPAPQPPARPVRLHHPALAWVVPQVVTTPGAHNWLQLQVNRPVSGRLSLRVNGAELASKAVSTRPMRRLRLPIPAGHGPIDIHLDET